MAVQATLKNDLSLKYRFESVKAAKARIKEQGLNPNDFVYEYVYDEMRKRHAPGYKEAHRKASREYMRRVRAKEIK